MMKRGQEGHNMHTSNWAVLLHGCPYVAILLHEVDKIARLFLEMYTFCFSVTVFRVTVHFVLEHVIKVVGVDFHHLK